MKKITTILLCVLLLAAITLTSVFATAGSAELAASVSTAKPGDIVEFVVSVEKFPEADTLSVTVTVPDGLTVQSGEWMLAGGFMSDYMLSMNLGIWGTNGNTVDLSAKTDIFKLTCIVEQPAVGQQDLSNEVKILVEVKAEGASKGKVNTAAQVAVSNPATELTLNKQTLQLDLSGTKTEQLVATVGPENTTETLRWNSTAANVATVSDNGTVTALAEGETVITATVGSLSKSCTVTVICGHSDMTEHSANTSTCLVNGNNLYFTCDTCGDVFKADRTTQTTVQEETLPLADHQGGTATCSQQAKCKWCEQPYGVTLPHTFTEQIEDQDHFVDGTGADCQQAKQYYYDCADCDTISTDKTFSSNTYGEHQFSSDWTSENDTHFHKCTVSGCTEKDQEGPCSGGSATCEALAVCATCQNGYGQLAQCRFTAMNPIEKHLFKIATCTEKAIYYYSCEMCDASGTDTFSYGDFADHDFSEEIEDEGHFVAGTGANCQQAKQYYYDCADCDTISTDKTFSSNTYGAHQVSNQWTTENEKHFHKCTVSGCAYKEQEDSCSGGTATCTAKAVCATCQVVYGTTMPHDFSERIEDETHFVAGSGADCQHAKQYYFDCADCDAIDTEYFNGSTCGGHQVSSDWANENDTHFHKCTVTGCSYKEQESPCSGGSATCEALAVCATCQNGYGQLAQCRFTAMNPIEKHLAKAATCKEQALYFYSCEMCDASGTDTFSYGDFADHDFSEQIEDEDHFVAGTGANCQQAKQYYYDCADCDTISTDKTFNSNTYGAHQVSNQWTTENEKHFHKCTVSGCAYKEQEGSCSGGTATCTDKAVCATCQAEYGALLPHNYSQQWTSTGTEDTDKHYRLCMICQTEKTDEAVHSFEWVIDSHPSEDGTGLKHEECNCGAKRSVGTVIDQLPHQHIGVTHYPEIAATCQSTGTVEYWTCASHKCAGKYYGDAAGTIVLNSIATEIDGDNHVHTEIRDQLAANCYQNGYTGDTWCLDCSNMVLAGRIIDATGNHTAGTVWYTDDNDHWHTCITDGCTALVDKTAHSYQWKVDTEATEDATGIKHEECVCSVKRSEGTVIEKLDHAHIGIIHHAAVKATCVSTGTVEYWTCSSAKCDGKYYGDAACQTEITALTEPVNAGNHAGLYVIDKAEATCSKTGYTGDTWCAKCNVLVKKGEVTLATGVHTAAGEYLSNKDQHWNVCACGEHIDKAAHTAELVDAKEATLTEPGYTGDEVCSVCGYVVKKGQQIPVETVPETEPATTEATQPTTADGDTSEGDQKNWIVPVVIAVALAVAILIPVVVKKRNQKD